MTRIAVGVTLATARHAFESYTRLISLVLAMMLSASAPVAAQPLTPAQEEQIKRGTTKIAIGAVLIGAGALMMPATSVGNTEAGAGLGLVIGGTMVVMWGVRDRHKATRPHLAFGATIGRSKAVYLRRRW